MKSFFKYTMACLLALILFSVVSTIITIVSFAGMMAMDGMTAPIKENSILRINLNGALPEQTEENPLAMFMGGNKESVPGLQTLTEAIRKAGENEHIKGIYIEDAVLYAAPATLQELRQALTDFKKSGKFIIAYSDNYSQSGYYICSVADKVMVNPEGLIDWHGLASETLFFKDALEKVGVRMQVFKVGTFKSAVEPFTNSEMSEANREQITSFLGNIWKNMLLEVSEDRKINVDKLNELADEYTALHPAQYLIDNRLADTLTYIDGVKDYLKKKMETDDDKALSFVSPKEMVSAEIPDFKEEKEKIAVYYAVGNIVQTADDGLSIGSKDPQIVGEKVVDDLRALREDDDVKAVVLRVNSGGGSAYASEQIWREVELLKEKKPVVVSMGGMAASGGYYISCGANKIYAEPATLTGSIGIFGMIPDISELVTQKVGLKFDAVKTNALSDMGTMSRPMNAEESRLMQAMVERGYETFTGRVAIGRKMPIEKVKTIAEGRVWTGEQAKELGLVDKLGNLSDAVKAAAKLAKVEKYNTVDYPAPEPWFTQFLNDQKSGYLDAELRNTLGEYYTTFSLLRNLRNQDRLQMRLPFDPNIK